ncbi:NDP-sugar synthase [Parabacteroides sp. PF5-9]|uniref:NDP-sugar synthase n=1 Tax=Parabacteroides sp. PF5-9 TaxID=1742404 RepID=UPI00247338DA|nr:NDP-sugar synthase [Parabacteroides sp. PF5-9]MDH6356504.1 NDP-sugar pyrophosphorylase family protein [Parabacteroides sp. PF5-9]
MDFAIIAAGEGSRLIQEGVKWPKPLVRLDGITLIDRLIHVFLQHNPTSINIIINEEMREVREHLEKADIPVPFHLVVKSTPSSMHSFYELSKVIKSNKFCLTTVDTIFKEKEFEDYIRTFEKTNELDGLMAVTDYIDDEKPLYVQTDRDFFIHQFSDSPEKACMYISGGIYCLQRSAFKVLEKAMSEGVSRMRNFQRMLISEGLQLKAYPFSKIIDVDHAEDILKAEAFLKIH